MEQIELEALRTRFGGVRGRLDLAEKQQVINTLEERTADPNLWNNPQEAQSITQRLSRAKTELDRVIDLESRIDALGELAALATAEADDSLAAELTAEYSRLVADVAALEIEVLLAAPYDDRDAFLSIKAGMGGTDAQDWAAMMMRMYTRWAERRGFRVTLVDESEGEEAGIKSATLEMRGDYAYGMAKAEAGVHRLIRLSPFNSGNTRQTSFALVEVLPEVDDAPEVVIRPEDLRIDVFRAGGHGGQGVNTTDSAVRITYRPGTPEQIVVTCQNERSQLQNRETAMRVLRGRLLERELQRQRAERSRLKGEHRQADFGSQMRTYYLHPYTLVKDHRTDHETSSVQTVLDGDLDDFVEAYLRWNVGRDA
ncbi:MAG TPA: peptide chain release factor 2 [Roseiflexaceae bacterium]|nr:peptide chain release factor 2 [Roseiflexaceae bacterium]HMP39823.1 peptide chain release factor 2 [Roseiflexaceae bacterium]